jgi:peptidyl-prolyl cis-trans isomerase-like 4
LVGTANVGPNMNTSDFFITLTDEHLKALDDKHTIFGEVAEGFEILEKLNRVHVNDVHRPLANVRILHTVVLDDPFPDPAHYSFPVDSPEMIYEGIDKPDYDMNLEVNISDAKDAKELDELKKQKRSRVIAHNLTLLEDRPDPDLKPPENVLFVCKLNPVTTER